MVYTSSAAVLVDSWLSPYTPALVRVLLVLHARHKQGDASRQHLGVLALVVPVPRGLQIGTMRDHKPSFAANWVLHFRNMQAGG